MTTIVKDHKTNFFIFLIIFLQGLTFKSKIDTIMFYNHENLQA